MAWAKWAGMKRKESPDSVYDRVERWKQIIRKLRELNRRRTYRRFGC